MDLNSTHDWRLFGVNTQRLCGGEFFFFSQHCIGSALTQCVNKGVLISLNAGRELQRRNRTSPCGLERGSLSSGFQALFFLLQTL